MKYIFCSLVLIYLCGCGHNVLTFSQGKYLNLGIDPGTSKVGVQYVNGEQITVVEKDNAKLNVELSDTLDADGKKTTSITKITYEIKEQATGADVELATKK
jgi:hypothetical protein